MIVVIHKKEERWETSQILDSIEGGSSENFHWALDPYECTLAKKLERSKQMTRDYVIKQFNGYDTKSD